METIDGIRVYERGENPLEKPYFDSLLAALPGWKVEEGPYCPGKRGHLTYLVSKDGGEFIAHVRDGDYSVSTEEVRRIDPPKANIEHA